MKRIFIVLAVLAFVACSESTPRVCDDSASMQIVFSDFDSSVRVFVYEGHEYLIARCVYGVDMCHSASCPSCVEK